MTASSSVNQPKAIVSFFSHHAVLFNDESTAGTDASVEALKLYHILS